MIIVRIFTAGKRKRGFFGATFAPIRGWRCPARVGGRRLGTPAASSDGWQD
jgi:hypothetical protein